jgi:hypothetical protein
LKPANVLVDHPPEVPLDQCQRLLLTDFGLAKRLEADPSRYSTHRGDVVGTPAYMAPEQVFGAKRVIGPAADVYGLGAILYELLTGRPPFRGESPFETAMQVISQPPEPPGVVNPHVPATLEAICLRCLEKDPSRRPSSAKALAEELESHHGGATVEPIRQRRLSGWRWFAVLVALLSLPVIMWQWLRSTRPPAPAAANPIPRFFGPLDRDLVLRGTPYDREGRFEPPGFTDSSRPKETVIRFDLCDVHQGVHQRHHVPSLTRNATIFDEKWFSIRYWRPVDEREWAEVVYRFDFDFPVRWASLYASLSLPAADSQGEFQVTSDPSRGWTTVCRDGTYNPDRGPLPISQVVHGSQIIYIKARIKGRDDGEESSLAQFLRSSTLFGDLHLHDQYVFEVRACDREVPFVKIGAKYGDENWEVVRFEDDGRFRLHHVFPREGAYLIRLRATVDDRPPLQEFRSVWVTTPGCEIVVRPYVAEVKPGELYRVPGQVQADPKTDWQGTVNFGDGTAEQPMSTHSSGTFTLEHQYAGPGRYSIWIALQDAKGRMTTARPTCLVNQR